MSRDKNIVNVKIPESVLDIFKNIYEFPDSTYNKDVVLYAIASSLPEKGRYLFAEDFKIDKLKLDEIINKRQVLANDNFKKDFKNIDKKLETLNDKVNENESLKELIVMNQTLIRLLLVDNFSLGTDNSSLNKYLSSESDQNIMDFVKSMN